MAMLLWAGYAHGQGQMTNQGNLKLHTGAQVGLYGNFANNGTFTDSSQAVSFNGTAVISGSAATVFRNLNLNNSAMLTLNRSVTINNAIALASGTLMLNGHTLHIAQGVAGAITRTSGYIVSEETNNTGTVSWNIGNNANSFVFPFATASGEYIPLTVQLTSGDIGTVNVSTYPSSGFRLPLPYSPTAVTHLNNEEGVDNSTNVVRRYWQIDKNGPSGTANITFTATTMEMNGLQGVAAQRWNSSNQVWDAPKTGQASGSNGATVYGVSEFSPWILATGFSGTSLPIELISFNAEPIGNDVQLDWVTAMELDNDYFTLERSKDGVNFAEVAQIDGAGLSLNDIAYRYIDTAAYKGLSYYRLKQTDFDGTYKYSGLRAVTIATAEVVQQMQVFPNPVSGNRLYINLPTSEDETIQIGLFDLLGHLVARYEIGQGQTHHQLPLHDTLPSGTYLVRMDTPASQQTVKVMVVR